MHRKQEINQSGLHTCIEHDKRVLVSRLGNRVDIDAMIDEAKGRTTPHMLNREIHQQFGDDADYASFAAALPGHNVISGRLREYRRMHVESKSVDEILQQKGQLENGQGALFMLLSCADM